MTRLNSIACAALGLVAAAPALAQVTVYGRVDLSFAQQAASVDDKEIRNGSGSRLGFRGSEDLGGGLKAVFELQHRFNADSGTQSTDRFWEGKSVVGLEGGFGRVLLGREENPAYTFSQFIADPWGTDTVASNGTIVNGRIGTTRYSGTVNYRFASGGFAGAVMVGESNKSGNLTAGAVADDPLFVAGLAYAQGPWTVGLGYEDPPDGDAWWSTVNGAYDFGGIKLGGLYGWGRNNGDQKHEAWLVTAVAKVGAGELRASYGQLKNKSVAVNPVLDEQASLGYHYALSKRTTVYTDLVNKNPDNLAPNLKKTGYDLGLKHNF